MLVASFLFGYGVGRDTSGETVPGYSLLREVEDQIADSSVKSMERGELVRGAIRGMLQALDDPYSSYLDPEAATRVFSDLTGHYSGVGLLIKLEEGRHKVVSVLADTPASRAGIQKDDLISAVDGKSVDGLTLEELTQSILGDLGTQVRVSVQRGDETREFTLTREQIDIPSVEHKLLKEGVGVIEVIAFRDETGKESREAVKSLLERGARAFILDLRGNPGGSADEAVEVASAFLVGGPVVSFKARGRPEVTYEAKPPQETDLPLVVLVDEGSASASEIVAGAIQDRGRGFIVGTETYGKGSVQTLFPLSDGGAIKITTASYYTPSGRSIGERGVIPDVSVAGSDMQLARAREILKEMLAEAPVRRAG